MLDEASLCGTVQLHAVEHAASRCLELSRKMACYFCAFTIVFSNKLLLSRVDNAVLDLYVVMPTTPQRMQCTFTVSRVWANAK